MTVKEVVAGLQKEKQEAVASRFPCRAVMVKNIQQYCDLLSELKKISDIRVVQASELFSSADVMPKYENLKASKYRNEWIILTGVSEYLRLFAKKEATDRRFASLWSYQAPASSTGRIIIPLWGCEAQWFDKALNLAGDLRQNDFYFDCSDLDAPEQAMNLLVLSGMFEQYLSKLNGIHGDLKIGLQDWFEYWSEPTSENKHFVLLTKRCSSIATTNGNVSIHVMQDTLSFIRENMKGAEILSKDNCTDEMQSVLFEYALQGTNLDKALLSILNVSTFSGMDIMGKWKAMPISHKLFVALWLKLHPDDTYINHCFGAVKDVLDIADSIMLEIFKFRLDKPKWVNEYRQLIAVMALVPNPRFFKELDLIPAYETRLDFMTGTTRDERIYLLRMVGKWMREDFSQVASSTKLEEVYPELFSYLGNNIQAMDDELRHYRTRYKSHKLENSLPIDEEAFFNGLQTDVYDNRYSVLSEYIDLDTIVLWIDALGVEWLPLLNWTLSQNCDGSIRKIAVTQAYLPTETCFNELWKQMDVPYNKLDKLDKLAHKGVIDEPDYYACIEDQLTFVAGAYKRVSELMEKHHRVIITGDHGTSRLAARFFHTRDGMDAPKNATVCSHGRYCELAQNTSFIMPNVHIVKCSDGTQYAIYKNYDHFKQSGFAAGGDDDNAIYGEVHGGATPEEMLVPVIVIDSNKEVPLTAEWSKSTVKIAMKKVRLTLFFNKPIHQLQVKVAGIDGNTTPTNDSSQWSVVLSGINQGTYPVQVHADNRIVTVPDITILPALGGDGDLP
jgi:hypothetical protein